MVKCSRYWNNNDDIFGGQSRFISMAERSHKVFMISVLSFGFLDFLFVSSLRTFWQPILNTNVLLRRYGL